MPGRCPQSYPLPPSRQQQKGESYRESTQRRTAWENWVGRGVLTSPMRKRGRLHSLACASGLYPGAVYAVPCPKASNLRKPSFPNGFHEKT